MNDSFFLPLALSCSARERVIWVCIYCWCRTAAGSFMNTAFIRHLLPRLCCCSLCLSVCLSLSLSLCFSSLFLSLSLSICLSVFQFNFNFFNFQWLYWHECM